MVAHVEANASGAHSAISLAKPHCRRPHFIRWNQHARKAALCADFSQRER